MQTLENWAAMWGVSAPALDALRALLVVQTQFTHGDGYKSEGVVQERTRLEAARRGDIMLFRNNVGALKDERGVPVRYGLCNESKKVNEAVKSADLIGIYRRMIRPEDVGQIIGQFVSVENKEEGWFFTGAGRETAQMNWATLVQTYGGIARFYAGGEADAFNDLYDFKQGVSHG